MTKATKKTIRYRALVVDDERDHCEMITDCLTRSGRTGIAVECVHTVRDACRALDREEFDFVLLDHNLPDGTGYEVLEEMDHRLLTTPVIGLSTSSDPQVAIADFRGGAIEFIQKHDAFRGDHLRQRVLEVLARHKRRIAATVASRGGRLDDMVGTGEALLAAARADPLLGIANRAALIDVHADLHRRAASTRRGYCFCVVDVDHFKMYNDAFGHAAGDVALTKVADALKTALRPGDFIARYGGEEIVVLLESVAGPAAAAAVARLVDRVAALALPHAPEAAHPIVTVSAGAAVFDPATDETVEQIFERADQAMYEAKHAGRNRAVVAEEGKGQRD